MVKDSRRRPASRKLTARALENQAICEAVDKAVALEEKKQPFSLSGRGHEPRVTLDASLARVLRDASIPAVHISGYGANTHYPARVFDRARQILLKRLRWSPIAMYQSKVYRATKPGPQETAGLSEPPKPNTRTLLG
jgi:hypothetical protein